MPGLCSVCKKDVGSDSDYITCSGRCKCVFHLRCTGVTTEPHKTRGAKKDWVCNNCKTKIQLDANEKDNKPQSVSKEMLVQILNEFKSEVLLSSITMVSSLRSLKSLYKCSQIP
uniref:PHD-type domain-containing protein n=1 Tax=Cuerna arida TaxID=1464854 RepID=A0A1B6ET75_9HEMI